jgi:hypothetical protein
VLTLADTGHPLTVPQVDDALTAYGVTERPEDRQELGQVVAQVGEWTWAEKDCRYVGTMAAGWADDEPDARHPWLLAGATRIAWAHRHGCLTEAGHAAAVTALVGTVPGPPGDRPGPR